jgi:cytochrome c556
MKVILTESQIKHIESELDEGRPPLGVDGFIKKSHEKHDEKRKSMGLVPYDYSKIKNTYHDLSSEVEITCPEHGSFFQKAGNHMDGKGCRKCAGNERVDVDEFIRSCHEKHDDKRKLMGLEPYDYSKVKNTYKTLKSKVEIICPNHDSFFLIASNHKYGKGCSKCAGNLKSNTEEFKQKAHKVHDDKRKENGREPYDYDKVNYVTAKTPVEIICHEKYKNGEEHGSFIKTPDWHLQGGGCRMCGDYLTTENYIEDLLKSDNIRYYRGFYLKDCISFKKSNRCYNLEFDFYLPEKNVLIEYDGEFHFEKHFNGTNDKFMTQVLNDREKNSFTLYKGIKLIRVSYLDKNNIEGEIIKGLKSKEQLYLSTNYPKNVGWSDINYQPTTKFIKKYYNNIMNESQNKHIESELDERGRTLANARKKRLFPKSAMMANPLRFKKYDKEVRDIDEVQTRTKKILGKGREREVYLSHTNPKLVFKLWGYDDLVQEKELFDQYPNLFVKINKVRPYENPHYSNIGYAVMERVDTVTFKQEVRKLYQTLENMGYKNGIFNLIDGTKNEKKYDEVINNLNDYDPSMADFFIKLRDCSLDVERVVGSFFDRSFDQFGLDNDGNVKCFDV